MNRAAGGGLDAAGLFIEKRRHVHDEASRGRRGGPGGLGGGAGCTRRDVRRAENRTRTASLLVFS